MRRLSISFLAFWSFMVPACADGPFGVTAGDDAAAFAGCKPLPGSVGKFQCDALPRAHPDVEAYVLSSLPGVGICWVRAASRAVETSSFGTEIRAEVDSFAQQIAEKYGMDRRKQDQLANGSLWREPRYWMMSLEKKDRAYGYQWSAGTGAKLPDRISSITVSPLPSSQASARVIVDFVFDNHSACEQAERKVKARAF